MSGFRVAVTAAFAFALTAVAGLPLPARAQSFGGNGIASNGFHSPVKGGGVVPNTSQPAPPGLPGAVRQPATAPSTKPITDMPPTEALFDAINRGDFATAQDALSRGADLYGHNVLGMTPLELSVDLGRNDITFLLLSLRSTQPPERAPSAADGGRTSTAAAAPPPAGRNDRLAALVAAGPLRHFSTTMRAARTRPADGAPGLAPASLRYAGANPGTPVPAAGFLGFGP